MTPTEEQIEAGAGAKLVAALVALAQHNIPPDTQDLLVSGDPMRGIAPGALGKAITAVMKAAQEPVVDAPDMAKRIQNEADHMQYSDDLDSMDDGIALMREAATAFITLSASLEKAERERDEAIARADKAEAALKARGELFGYVQPETAEMLSKHGNGYIRPNKDEAHGYTIPLYTVPPASAVQIKPLTTAKAAPAEIGSFQARVHSWMMACFGAEISSDKVERGDRFLEEVFELLQSGGYDPARIVQIRDYVWGRPSGDPHQEAGGVMVTLAAYCLAFGLDMHAAGETELSRIWAKVDQIRAKQAAKPKHSPLPVAAPAVADGWLPSATLPTEDGVLVEIQILENVQKWNAKRFRNSFDGDTRTFMWRYPSAAPASASPAGEDA